MEPHSGVIDSISSLLLSQGLSGLAIFALGYFNLIQYRRNNELSDTNYKLGLEVTKAQEQTVAAINRLSDLLLRGRGVD